MMALFQLSGVLPADTYLPGQYQWNTRQRLQSAQLTVARPPSVGTLTLTLELNGGATAHQFTIAASALEVVQTLALGFAIPAHTWVRWRATATGLPEDAALQIDLTLSVAPAAAPRRPRLSVQWREGRMSLVLYTYDPVTHSFTEATPTITSGRAVLTRTGDSAAVLAIQGEDALRVEAGILKATPFYAVMGVATVRSPRVQFCIDDVPIATLTSADFRVIELTEAAPDVLTTEDDAFYERFEFYSDGVLTAALSAAGLTALALEEL